MSGTRIILELKNGKHKKFEPPSGQYVEGGDGVCIDLSSLKDVAKIHVTMNPYFEFRDLDEVEDDEDYDEYCAPPLVRELRVGELEVGMFVLFDSDIDWRPAFTTENSDFVFQEITKIEKMGTRIEVHFGQVKISSLGFAPFLVRVEDEYE